MWGEEGGREVPTARLKTPVSVLGVSGHSLSILPTWHLLKVTLYSLLPSQGGCSGTEMGGGTSPMLGGGRRVTQSCPLAKGCQRLCVCTLKHARHFSHLPSFKAQAPSHLEVLLASGTVVGGESWRYEASECPKRA